MTAEVPPTPSMESIIPDSRSTIAVIITTFNHARFLADAISSALAQTRPADEIIVVDDGSADDPATVVAKFDGVRLIGQQNRGLSAARNTGLRACTTSHVVFLDADDCLLPSALETGLNCAAARPDCAFVYGGHRFISEDGRPWGPDRLNPTGGDAHLALLRGNLIGMHATVVYRRDRLIESGAFDESLRRCEDYDLYLRITQSHPIASHPAIVAEYRKHGQNMTSDPLEMLQWSLAVLDRREKHLAADVRALAALREGQANWRSFYASEALDAVRANWGAHRAIGETARGLVKVALLSPSTVTRMLVRVLGRLVKKGLPSAGLGQSEWLRWRFAPIPLGSARFGDLKRTSPISSNFGFDRGTPVDRYYIERFLVENMGDIQGRVLEIGDNTYTLRFGGTRVERSDILHVDATNPRATFIADLTRPDVLPEAAFDCIVLTQTLHLLFDMQSGIATLCRALKPGGVLLLTTPGISQVDGGEWRDIWYWSLTAAAARRLLEAQFRPEAVVVETHGNVFAATAFLYGLAVEELDRSDLDVDDPSYPVIVMARAIKAMHA
jgi:glycosyltransferase involved in cell wall biosynthesis/SAM-dependent methyltransferase